MSKLMRMSEYGFDFLYPKDLDGRSHTMNIMRLSKDKCIPMIESITKNYLDWRFDENLCWYSDDIKSYTFSDSNNKKEEKLTLWKKSKSHL